MTGARKIWLVVGTLLALGLLGTAAAVRWTSKTVQSDDTPVVQVKRGDLDSQIYAIGELRPTHSNTLAAPQIGGGSLQITHLLREAAKTVEISFLDHVIIGRTGADPLGRGYYSFRDSGLI